MKILPFFPVTMIDPILLSWVREGYPARLDSEKTAKLLGFGAHDLPALVGAGLLKPLGNPSPNAPKFFALIEILALAADRDWLNRATKTVSKHWQKKNDEQRCKRAECDRPVVTDDCLQVQKTLSAKVPATSTKK